ncbi:MAG TPA: tRNA lysidine(34) synthetase TilS [Thermoanaerobaculia bacterium]|nr:tRNA lysidine(34) synthetase TilS [Thermoanaerobaculia bacterium]
MIGSALRQFFVKNGIPPGRIVVAVSGGADSTALLVALAELGEHELICAHVNHHLRGAESDGDEAFVRDLAARWNVAVHVADGTLDPGLVRERGVEAAARSIRYDGLAAIREKTCARSIATAHQKNDQAETVLMRLLTGSGIAGLRGIHPVREDGFIRPLLEVTREEIDAFLRERDITPRFDRSNDDPRFLRNRVRVLVRELGATGNLAAIAAQARGQWPLLERAIDEAERAHTRINNDNTRFTSWPEEAWVRGALLRRHILRLDPEARDFDAERIAAEVNAVRRLSVTRNLELIRKGEHWILRKPPEPMKDFEVELTAETAVYVPELGMTVGVLRAPLFHSAFCILHSAFESSARNAECKMRNAEWKRDEGPTAASPCTQPIQLPPGAVPTFTIRNRRPGDRFHPLGMSGPKKLKDFLIDRKIAAEVRDRLPLLIWNGEIVWVAGVEVSERFKVTSPRGGELYEVWMEGPGAADERDQAGLQR